MLSLISLSLLGLLFGIRHATDPDHVVAVSTFVSRSRSVWRAGGVGVLWGIGHTGTIVVVGGAIILLRLAIEPRVGLAMEFGVAMMLIALGVTNLAGARTHDHARDLDRRRPILVGIVHGLDGSAAVALLVLSQIGDAWWALAYLIVFGVGTILGMLLVTAAIAVPALYLSRRVAGLQHGFRLASGVVSVVFGLYLAHQAGIVNGLFTDQPHWTAR